MDMLSLLQKQQLVERISQVKESKKMTWRQIAEGLYQILDDIGTCSDWCKGNAKAFMENVLRINARKNQFLTSPDGYTLERVDEELAGDSREEIPLTNSQLKAMVDPEDFDRVSKLSWFLKTDRRTNVHYVARSEREGRRVKTIRLHRFVTNAGPNDDVHHKDLNPLNNHRENLEVVPKEVHRSFHTKHHYQRVPALATEESIKECVCHIYEMGDDDLLRFYLDMPKSYIGSDGKRFDTYSWDKGLVEKEIGKRGLSLPKLDEEDLPSPEPDELELLEKKQTFLVMPSKRTSRRSAIALAQEFGSLDAEERGEKFLQGKGFRYLYDENEMSGTNWDPRNLKKDYGVSVTLVTDPSKMIWPKSHPEEIQGSREMGESIGVVDESTMTDWARNELQLAGLFDKESDYEGMLGEAVMELMDKFAEQGHSGFSASLVSSIFDRLSHWKPLSELTNDPAEWMEVTDHQEARTPGLKGPVKCYQSRRSPDCFSEDGGQTYYSIDDPCFEGTEENGVTFMRYCPETWAKVTIHTAKKRE